MAVLARQYVNGFSEFYAHHPGYAVEGTFSKVTLITSRLVLKYCTLVLKPTIAESQWSNNAPEMLTVPREVINVRKVHGISIICPDQVAAFRHMDGLPKIHQFYSVAIQNVVHNCSSESPKTVMGLSGKHSVRFCQTGRK